jgi:hypothetical protein
MTTFADTMKKIRQNKARRFFPDYLDARLRHDTLFSDFIAKFPITFDDRLSVFTLGPNLSRHLEDALSPLGATLPTLAFTAPDGEYIRRPHDLLSDFNPGTISQRILNALAGRPAPPTTIVTVGALVSDLLLPGEGLVTRDRAASRRQDIFAIDQKLATCDLVFITLSGIEAWFDRHHDYYMNRMPPIDLARNQPGRFDFRTLDVPDAMPLLTPAIKALGDAGKKVILAISPVPQRQTYEAADAISANEFSKSVLRVCAESLAREFGHVDYFPAYEIARWAGLAALDSNHIHLDPERAAQIMQVLVVSYALS